MKRVAQFLLVSIFCLCTVTAFASEAYFHSSNDMSIAKKGKSGVYAYSEDGRNYSIYYIIDFDEGYVYFFTEGNASTVCDRVKIVKGSLNDVVIITYHDGDDQWSNGLHFKWVNRPERLIVQDNDGFEWEYKPTSLSKALELRNSKQIYDY